MITEINETEIENLLNITEELLDKCKGNGLLDKRRVQELEDLVYYFRKAALKCHDYDLPT